MSTRREFLRNAALSGAAGMLWPVSGALAAEPPPETTRIRLLQDPNACWAPQYFAEELLRGEGLSDVIYVQGRGSGDVALKLASGEIDMSQGFVTPSILQVDAGKPVVILAGIHPGCLELFVREGIGSVRDLKGRVVSVSHMGGGSHLFLASMASFVGLDPQRDINWVVYPNREAARLLGEGKIDALLASPPAPQEMRAKGIGRVIVNTTTDRPWSQYLCCTVNGNREFVRRHPVAVKRVLRALLKANSVCSAEPERVARFLVDQKFTANYDYALQALREIPYLRWRDFNVEDTVRFYALRLQEGGMIKSSPKKILAEGADWRFFNELKKELKA